MSGTRGPRFEFGNNWRKFSSHITDEQRRTAADSLTQWLGDLRGKSFLDIGAGSGLLSAAAADLGATVHAFDYDPSHPGIERGDVLDTTYMGSLGTFDIVYAWGVLHHTGKMWQSISIASDAVNERGALFISIYNDQGWKSRWWRFVKRTYGRLPNVIRPAYVVIVMTPLEVRAFLAALAHRENYFKRWTGSRARGMSKWTDMVDWVGGYPFEVASPDDVFSFAYARGFALEKLRTTRGGSGCNQYLFRRRVAPS